MVGERVQQSSREVVDPCSEVDARMEEINILDF